MKPKLYLHRNIQNGISLTIETLWPSQVNVKLRTIVPQSLCWSGAFYQKCSLCRSLKARKAQSPCFSLVLLARAHSHIAAQVSSLLSSHPDPFFSLFLPDITQGHPVRCKAYFILLLPWLQAALACLSLHITCHLCNS